MNTKALAYVIIGIIGVVGSIAAFFVLALLAGSASFFYVAETDPAYAELKTAGDTLIGFVVLGVVWIACTAIASIVTLLSGIKKMRKN